MKRQSKFLLILLCLSLLLFKAVSAHRFIENGIKRAQMYSNYTAYILNQEVEVASRLSDQKNNLTRAISAYMLAIVIGLFLIVNIGLFKQIMRPAVKFLNGRKLNQKIFKPPKNTYIPI
jgi:hypothetical protein